MSTSTAPATAPPAVPDRRARRTRPTTSGGRWWRRWRWAVVLAWVALAVVAVPLAGRLGDVVRDTPASSLPAGAQSTEVAQLQEDADGGRAASTATVVFTRPDGARLDVSDLAAVTARQVAAASLHSAQVSTPTQVSESEDGRAALFDVTITPVSATDDSSVGDAVSALRRIVAQDPPTVGVRARVTGDAAIETDTDAAGVDSTLLLTSALIVAGLLLLIYRSPLLWVVPIVAAAAAVLAARAAAYGLGEAGLTVSSLASSVQIVLVFGAATDYALLVINRYRQELARHRDHHDALADAWRRTLPALGASAATVIAAMSCLQLAQLGGVRGLGPIGAVGVACALLAELTLLPAVLALCGRRLLWPRAPRFAGAVPAGTSDGTPHRVGVWPRIASAVARRPAVCAGAVTVVLAGLAIGLFGLHGTQDPLDQLKGNPDSARGARVVAQHFSAGQTDPLTVVLPAGSTTASRDAVAATARQTPGVASVDPGDPIGGRTALDAVLVDDPTSVAAGRVVDELRVRLADRAGVLVGGDAAIDADYRNAANRDTAVLVPVVLAAVGVILVLLLRSLVAPLLLLGAVALTFAAAWGTTVWVSAHVLGYHGVQEGLVIYAFVFLVALGVDYTIFYIERVRELRRHRDTSTAASEALTATGGVITAAAFVLAGTFAALAQLPTVALTQVGIAVAVGVLLDALLVRSLLVPAALHLLGDRVWWPRRPAPPVDAHVLR